MIAIFPIVEGHGDVDAVRVLLHRIASCLFGGKTLNVLQPYRIPKTRMVAPDRPDLAKAVQLGAMTIRNAGGIGSVLVLVDADDDCAVSLAQRLAARVARPDIATAIVVADREFEAWFLAAAESLAKHKRVRPDCRPPEDPEIIRDAKGWLAAHLLKPGLSYRETVDQVAFASLMDLRAARTARSFDKLCRTVGQLLQT